MTQESSQTPYVPRPFADSVVAYAQAGWPAILPVPPAEKFPPPGGFTGADGRDTDPLTLAAWASGADPHRPGQASPYPGYSVALRMPDGVIGIDVDQYVKAGKQKRGAETLAAYVAKWGPLPATWTSTAREADGPSRIYLYRVPPGRYASRLADPVAGTGDIEIVQRHHRYAVVWPSPHTELGSLYRWYDPTGQLSESPPKPSELAELPEAWVTGLADGASAGGPVSAAHNDGRVLLDQIADDWRPECAEMTSARMSGAHEIGKADAGSRHDTMVERLYPIVQLAAHGHPGAAHALLELRDLWGVVTAGENRAQEFEDSLLGAARKAVTVVGVNQVPRDPCLMVPGFPAPLPVAPPNDRPDPAEGEEPFPDLTIAEAPRWVSVRELIGTHAFEPLAGLDQTLAEAVLQRVYPMMRYAYDARGWLVRQPERWELHGDQAAWAVAQVAALMPIGDPTAEKGSDAHDRHLKRTRLMTNAGANAVAGKMASLVAGGLHPAAVALGGLDADPELVWAGGAAWSLRDSVERPEHAEIDPTTPHMHSAAVAPARVPTPLWDAFLAAVWPDESVRRWALRVMAVCLTGYADRALPILIGETGRGKTALVTLMMSVLGSYAHAANPKLLLSSSNHHDTIVYQLKGRRMSFIDEGPSERKAGQERLKQITGGGELTANPMHKDPVTFRPTHTLVLTTNEEPVLTDPAVRDRVRLLPCDGDPELVKLTRRAIGSINGPAWRREAPGVLAAMMMEAAGLLRDPDSGTTLAAPEHIRYHAESLAVEQDPVVTWLSEECETYPPGTPSRELYQAFRASAQASGIPRDQLPTESRWGKALTRHGYPPAHTRTGKVRALRIRIGGHPDGLDPQPADSQAAPLPLVTGCDGLVTGQNANPSQTSSQVNPTVSDPVTGVTGLELSNAYEETPPESAIGEKSKTPVNPSQTPVSGPLSDPSRLDPQLPLVEVPASPPTSAPGPSEKPKSPPSDTPKKQTRQPADPAAKAARAAAAREAKAEQKAQARLQAIEAAAGGYHDLPAVVTRDGVIRPCRLEQADQLLATISSGPTGELTVDVEHTGYPLGHADYRLRTIQLGDENVAVVLDAADQLHTAVAQRHLLEAPVLHAHSGTADLAPLADAGLVDYDEAMSRLVDTAVLAKLADPTSTDNSADLKGLAKAVLGKAAASTTGEEGRKALFKAGGWIEKVEVTVEPERSGWAQVDHRSAAMIRYDASDVLDCAALANRLPALEPHLMAREQLAQTMTARIAFRGVRIDSGQVGGLLPVHEEAKDRFAERIAAYGIANPGSPAQVSTRMAELGAHLPRTDAGNLSVAEGVLERMVGNRDADPTTAVEDLARSVIDWREHDTALKLFLRPYDVLVKRGDGRARPTVYTLGAKTGRMSCQRPNLQQLPREGGFRACITADPGYLLISADFAQVELRVAAALSKCPSLTAIVNDPERDLHLEVAQIAFGPHVTKKSRERYAVKRGVFGRIYGGGVPAVAAGVGVSDAKAKAVIDAMDTMTPGLTEWSRQTRSEVESGHTQFRAYSGRVIHLRKNAAHAAPNYKIQGTARELLIDALERWAQTPWGRCLIWPVHDEVVAMVPEAEAEAATAALAQCMTSELYGIPIIADPGKPAFAWADAS